MAAEPSPDPRVTVVDEFLARFIERAVNWIFEADDPQMTMRQGREMFARELLAATDESDRARGIHRVSVLDPAVLAALGSAADQGAPEASDG